jgi:hypothetical protein
MGSVFLVPVLTPHRHLTLIDDRDASALEPELAQRFEALCSTSGVASSPPSAGPFVPVAHFQTRLAETNMTLSCKPNDDLHFRPIACGLSMDADRLG